MITVSIVSHGHGDMVRRLVDQLQTYPEVTKIVLTLNIPEPLAVEGNDKVSVIQNKTPQGFGKNHNEAFKLSAQPYFCVLNPDVVMGDNPFGALIDCLKESQSAVAAPMVLSPDGDIEDSVRHFPTPVSLLRKLIGTDHSQYVFQPGQSPFFPDWVAGMFMLFRSNAFSEIKGFDEAYHLYYEDVDICHRLWRAGKRVVFCPSVNVVHDARRASHRNLRHLRWHFSSMMKFFWRRLW